MTETTQSVPAEPKAKSRGRRSRAQRIAERSIARQRKIGRDKRYERARRQIGASVVKGPARSTSEAPTAIAGEVSRETVYAPDKSLVSVAYRGYSFRGLPDNQVRAAGRFSQDYEAAYAKLSSKGFEPGVDGGSMHVQHLRAVSAQGRVRAVETKLGHRDYTILVAVVIAGVGPAKMRKEGGPEHKTVSNEIRRILRELCAFYSGKPAAPDKLLVAAERLVRAALEDRSPEAFLGGAEESNQKEEAA